MKPRWSFAEWHEANLLLARRSRGRCEWCGGYLETMGVERHHRVRRRDGGDRLSNLLMLCPEHHRYAHQHPAEARERGVIVLSTSDPETVPYIDPSGVSWLLRDDGSRTPYDV